MRRPYELITIQTIVGEEVREDPESGESYVEEVVIAKDKKTKLLLDLDDIQSVEEHIDESGKIYSKRCVVIANGQMRVVAKSYKEMKDLFLRNDNQIGFNGTKED